MKNLILSTDSYKLSHYLQYPNSTTHVSSYIEARGIAKGFPNTDIVFFGLQAFLDDYMTAQVTKKDVNKAKYISQKHGLPFNEDGWNLIIEKYDGFLPITIRALREGSVVPIGTPLVQVENTDPVLPWMTSYIETALLRSIWYPTTVATLSYAVKNMMRKYWVQTVDEAAMAGLNFAFHDFGARGVSSSESAELGGMAHLLSFNGTDNLEALQSIQRYYITHQVHGFSVPAAEHSTITSWGEANERDAYENMIDKFGGPGKIYSVVADSYDILNAVDKIITGDLLPKIVEKGGRFVIRPDSGVPSVIVMNILDILEQKVPITVNEKGYKVLPDYFRILQGDGVDYYAIEDILNIMMFKGWSSENIVFGAGGSLLQKVNRDTLKFAMKQNAIKIDRSEWIPVQKKPKHDITKASKPGYITDANLELVWYKQAQIIFDGFDDIKKRIVLTSGQK